MNILVPLSSISKGQKAKVKILLTEGAIKRRMQDIGITEDTEIELALESPLKDPKGYIIKGSLIAIRNSDAEKIIVSINETNKKEVI